MANDNGNRQATPIEVFRGALQGPMRDEISKQLPQGIDPDRFIRTAITAVQMNPGLLQADRTSLFGAVMQAAKDGLLPDGREAVIQVYRTNVGTQENPRYIEKAQMLPMVAGLIAKMYEAGCKSVDGAAVYEKDHFRFTRGDNPSIEHEPYLGEEDPGPIVAAYAIIKLSTGEVKREVMPKRDINKVRAVSKAKNGPGWQNWEDQFAIKAVLKRAYKQVPHTSETLRSVIEQDNEAMGFDFAQKAEKPKQEAIEQKPAQQALPKPSGRSARLEAILGGTTTMPVREREKVPVAAAAAQQTNGHQHEANPHE